MGEGRLSSVISSGFGGAKPVLAEELHPGFFRAGFESVGVSNRPRGDWSILADVGALSRAELECI